MMLEMDKVFIYGLVDPITDEIRYVGKSNKPNRRFKRHIINSKYKRTYKDKWLLKLLSNDLKPKLIILEKCTKDNWVEREVYHISKYDNLTNLTLGGEGLCGYEFTKIHKQRISENHYDVSGKNNPMFGRNHSDEVKEKSRLRALGRKANKDTKKKMSDKKRGENNNNVKLNKKDVLKIRELYKSGNYQKKELADLFNVQGPCIYKIINRLSWKHI